MTSDLEQLFRDSDPTAPTSRIDLDVVVRRGRRVRVRYQVRTAATIGVTGAVVVGVAALATSSHLPGGGSSGALAGGVTTPTPAPSGNLTVSASFTVPTPTPSRLGTGIAGSGSASATPSDKGSMVPATGPTPLPTRAPADLTAVALPDPAPGFGPRRSPDSVARTLNLNGVPGEYWVATFLVGVSGGTEATVFVGEFPMPTTSGTPTLGQSPGPITDHPTVHGRQAYVTHDGVQTILFFQTSRYTVEVVGEQTTVAELVTLAESLRNIG